MKPKTFNKPNSITYAVVIAFATTAMLAIVSALHGIYPFASVMLAVAHLPLCALAMRYVR